MTEFLNSSITGYPIADGLIGIFTGVLIVVGAMAWMYR